MPVSSRSVLLPTPATTSYASTEETMDESTGMEESSSSEMKSYLKKWRWEQHMIDESKAEEMMYRLEMRENTQFPAFQPETFGDENCLAKLKDSFLRGSIVSIALFSEDVMVYACSGTAVRHWHGNIQDHHRIFVTSAQLARKFEDHRTRDDNLRIELRTSDGQIMHGFLELYDVGYGIAILTSFSIKCVYTMDTTDHPLSSELIAFGRAIDGALMGANCSNPVSTNERLELECKIKEIGLGGPVISFRPDGSAHIAGLIVGSYEGKITLVPTRQLHDWLQRFLKITSKTRGYSLPKGVQTVIPSGFMVESKILQSLGYPLPPALLFELNGRIAGRFEEHFGQLHYWDGYPFDIPYNYGPNPIWDQLGERLVQKISQSVVSIASIKDGKRCFACTGLLIKGRDRDLRVLTSASLVRTGARGKIDGNLKIETFLPPNHYVEGVLELYHQNYNIAIVRLDRSFATAISPQDLLNDMESRKKKSVVAIGRATKVSHGLLMASIGEVKGKYKTVKNKPSTSLAKKIDCKELRLSTCEITKVGIGGPLIGMDGGFIGMNFYDESETTPFLPRKEILMVLREGFDLLESNSLIGRPININMEDTSGLLSSKRPRTTGKIKTNRWPVSEPYWYLPGQAHVLDQLVGKVLM